MTDETRSAASLRDALIDRWFDIDEDHHDVTDEQILARIEELVGEGWHTAGRETDRVHRLREALARVTGYEGAEIDALLAEYARA